MRVPTLVVSKLPALPLKVHRIRGPMGTRRCHPLPVENDTKPEGIEAPATAFADESAASRTIGPALPSSLTANSGPY